MEGEYVLRDPSEPLYYAKDRTVFRQPTGRKNEDGTTNWTLGIKVCTVMEGISPKSVAEMLTAAETQLPD